MSTDIAPEVLERKQLLDRRHSRAKNHRQIMKKEDWDSLQFDERIIPYRDSKKLLKARDIGNGMVEVSTGYIKKE
jgi:hypothetical protein